MHVSLYRERNPAFVLIYAIALPDIPDHRCHRLLPPNRESHKNLTVRGPRNGGFASLLSFSTLWASYGIAPVGVTTLLLQGLSMLRSGVFQLFIRGSACAFIRSANVRLNQNLRHRNPIFAPLPVRFHESALTRRGYRNSGGQGSNIAGRPFSGGP